MSDRSSRRIITRRSISNSSTRAGSSRESCLRAGRSLDSSRDSDTGSIDGSLSRQGSKKRKSIHGDPILLCNECPDKEAKIQELTGHLEQLRLEISDDSVIRRQAQELAELNARYNEMKQKYEEEREAKDNALLRLSSIASSRLRDNNPNIADLSDKYRPTKLADIFSAIYDNEWTDAYEELEKEPMEEKDLINILLHTVMYVYMECKVMAEDQLNTVVKMMVSPFAEDHATVPDSLKEAVKSYKDYRKTRAMDTLPNVVQIIEAKQELQYMHISAMKTYVEACLRVCWLAVLQDPPVVLYIDQHPTSKFDSDRFKDYTKRGPYVDYVVWPALYLCEGGALLQKGVAQGANSPTSACDNAE